MVLFVSVGDTQDLSKLVDYAHEGTGFPTWHRQFLLWLEREIQVEIDDIEFRLPYWDWSDPDQREILFERDRLGKNVEDTTFPDLKRRVVVKGELFDNWDTYCWSNTSGLPFGIPVSICDPTESSNETLRRCPYPDKCEKSNEDWPSKTDVEDAVAIEEYDSSPYHRCIDDKEHTMSFRNYMEGFLAINKCSAGNTLCSSDKSSDKCPGLPITRKLHNTVSTLLLLCSHTC